MEHTGADDRFQRVAVVGTGQMGPAIAVTLARGAGRVAVIGRSEEGLQRGHAHLDRALGFLLDNGLLDEEEAAARRARIWFTPDMAAGVEGAGLVQESIPENLAAKQELFAALEEMCPPETILTSDTSGLRITDIAAHLQHPERCATLHYWNPPHLIPLVEITQGERTSEDTVNALVGLMRRCGKVPVVARKDVPGQIANRLQHALFREAINMVQEGIASPEDVDLALKMGPGRRWPVYGVLEHHDVVGNDLGLAVQSSLVPGLARNAEPAPYLREMVERGELGMKTGKGWYDWSEHDPARVTQRRDAFLVMLAREWTEE